MPENMLIGNTSADLLLFESMPQACLLLNADLRIITASEDYLILTNKSRSDIAGRLMYEVLPSKSQDGLSDGGIQTSLEYVLETKSRNEIPVTRYDVADGSGTVKERYWKTVHQPVLDAEGNLIYIIHQTEEVTGQVIDKKQLERAIEDERLSAVTAKRLNEQMKNLFQDIPAQIAIVRGPDLVYDYINPQYQRELFPNREVLGLPLLAALPEIEGKPIWDILQGVYQSGVPHIENEMHVELAGQKGAPVEDHYFNTVYQPLYDDGGKVNAVLSFKYEVTRHVAARKALEASSKQLEEAHHELNSSYQELQALHEELQAANEELTSTNEELVRTQDELQRLNAELEERVVERTRQLSESFEEQQALNEEVSSANAELAAINEELVATNEELAVTQQLLKESVRQKDEFLSIASHELKTPLTSIKAFNQIIQRVNDSEKLKTFIQKSADQIFRLEKLINDLLDVTKINAGKMVYDMQPFDFLQMVKDAIESVQLKEETHQLILKREEAIIYAGDRLRLEQVMNNMLTNAIKYSPEAAEVWIELSLQDNNIIVSVQDFGVGIDGQHLDHLFDRYYRVDNTAMRFEGLGLGLFISSEILKRHGGNFWIESEPGRGSTFYFRLPLPDREEHLTTNNEDLYRDSTVTIHYLSDHQRLNVDWTGFQDTHSVQSGCIRMLEMLKRFQVTKIFNDNSNVKGTWSEAADWAGKVWFPQMEAAGLRHFAWIYSPSTFSKLSADKSVNVMQGDVITQFFTTYQDADEWLNSI